MSAASGNSSSRHVFDVLRLVRAAPEPISVTEVGRTLGLPTATAHRALATLEESGYVARYRASARYVMGPMVPGLMEAFFARFHLRDLAMPYLRTLALLTGESVSLLVPVGWNSVRAALVAGVNEVIHTGPLGETRRLTDGFGSHALLASFPEAQAEEILRADAALRGAKAKALRERLAAIRRCGYSAQDMDSRPGFAAVAVPLRGNESAAAGAIVFEGPVLESKRGAAPPPLPLDWLRIIGEMEAHLRANPRRFENHYAHIDPRTISFAR